VLLSSIWPAEVTGGTAVADLKTVIGLLYRADWTRLSLSGEVRFESDRDLALSRIRATRPPGFREGPVMRAKAGGDGSQPAWEEVPGEELGGYHFGRATLLIAPGGRHRQERGDEPAGLVTGSDGERGWMWCRPDLAPPPWVPVAADPAPPLPELFCPSGLLSGLTLEMTGPVTACGRNALVVVATPRADIGHVPGLRSVLFDRLEMIVDAELGILLRREETFEGERLSLTELTVLVLDPAAAADSTRFAPPPGSHISQDMGESLRQAFGGPGWERAKTAAGLAAGGLGAVIRFAPRRPGHEDNLEAAMPPAEPAAHDRRDRTPVPDDVLYLLYRSGANPVFGATLHEWQDFAAMAARVPDSARAAGHGGVGYLLDALDAATREKPVTHTVARLLLGGRDQYRVDYPHRTGRHNPKTIASDGQHRWRAFAAQTMVGPAAPLPHDIANLADSSWLLHCRLAGGKEISYRGRRAYQLSAAGGDRDWPARPLLFFPADAIVDAELGCLLRLISYAGERPASWWELRDIGAGTSEPDEFRPPVPPGVRIVQETGNPLADAAAVMPGTAGCAVRTGVDVVRRTSGAAAAARSFLDELRGTSRT
jgi:hypothetical protein